MKALPTPASAGSWEAQNNLVIEQNFRQLEEGLRAGYQPLDATLTAFAALSGAADKLPYFTANDAFALADFTAFGRSFVNDANAAAGRTTLELGTASVKNTGTSGDVVPLLNTACTWSANQTFVGTWRNTPATNKHILSADVTASAIADFTTGGAGLTFSRASDGVDGLAAIFQYTSSGGAFNLAIVARDDLVFGTGGGALYGSSLEQLRLTLDGRLYGKSLHNNAGAITGTTNQYIASGTYTPTITAVTNVTSSTATVCQYTRVGNVVTVSGEVGLTPTGAGTMTARVSLPVASNFASSTQLGGTAVTWNTGLPLVGAINADSTNDAAQFRVENSAGVGITLHFTFQYLIV